MAAPAGDEVPGARDVDDMVAEMSARMNALSARTERVMREQVPDPGAPSVLMSSHVWACSSLGRSIQKMSARSLTEGDGGGRRASCRGSASLSHVPAGQAVHGLQLRAELTFR